MFSFLKKDGGQAPPDVGQEDAFDEENVKSDEGEKKLVGAPDKLKVKKEVSPSVVSSSVGGSVSGDSVSKLELEKIKGRIESVVEWINQFYERFAYVSENIGELRAMNIANEKKILNATKEAEKVIDIVKDVKPSELRLDYQKVDIRMKTFEEKVTGNRQFMDDMMKEVEDIKRKSEIFVGTESLMKLNEDTKKDLIEMQKINSKTKMHADKSQEVFMEIKRGFADSQKLAAIVDNLEGSYSGLREELERVKLNHETVVNQKSFDDFSKTFGNKIAILDGVVEDLDSLKNNNNLLGTAIEDSLSIARRNKDDIGKVAMKVGDSDVKSITDYENQIADILGVVDSLAAQVVELKKKAKGVVNSEKLVVGSREAGGGKGTVIAKKDILKKPIVAKSSPVVKKDILEKPIVKPKSVEDLDSSTKLGEVKKEVVLDKAVESGGVEKKDILKKPVVGLKKVHKLKGKISKVKNGSNDHKLKKDI